MEDQRRRKKTKGKGGLVVLLGAVREQSGPDGQFDVGFLEPHVTDRLRLCVHSMYVCMHADSGVGKSRDGGSGVYVCVNVCMYTYSGTWLYEGLELPGSELGGKGILLMHYDSSSGIENGCHRMSILLYSSIVSRYLFGQDWGSLYDYEMNMVRG